MNDQALVTVAYYFARRGIFLGPSSALNVASAIALSQQPMSSSDGATMAWQRRRRIVTLWCDSGERSFTTLYNAEFLAARNLVEPPASLSEAELIAIVCRETTAAFAAAASGV